MYKFTDFDKVKDFIKKGTTTVGIVCKNGIVLSADKRASLGSTISSKKAVKIHSIDDHVAVTISGLVGDAERLVRVMRSQAKLYKTERRDPMTIRATATLLSNIMNSYRLYPFITQLVLGGVDRRGSTIYLLDPYGSLASEEDDYYASGSGSPIAYGVLEEGYKENLEVKQGVKLAIRSIQSARKRDVYTGGLKAGISVATINKEEGFKRVPEKDLEKHLVE